MPMVNFCKKCKAEVPAGEQCPHCLGRLTRSGERLSFGLVRVPVRDWFSWNQALRVMLPTLGLVAAATLLMEGAVSGSRGIQALFLQGFFWTLMGVLGLMLLAMLTLLTAQGKETVRFVFDRDGIHAYTYLNRPSALRLYSRFLTWASMNAMQKEELSMEGYHLVKRVDVLWTDIKRVRFWKENRQILLFKPAWWQALSVTCPLHEYEAAEAFLRKKLGRNKKVKIIS